MKNAFVPSVSLVDTDNKYQVGTHVRLHVDNEWDGLYGIVDCIERGIVHVFCTVMPLYRYFVHLCDADSVLKVVR